jgi:hypothetical protein
VVALVTSAGGQREMDRYSAYGVPFGLPEGDSNSDGLADATDRVIIQGWINTSAYDVRGDVDLDGDVDINDKNAVAALGAVTLGRGALSAGAVINGRGLGGSQFALAYYRTQYCMRRRIMDAEIGRWLQRDPVGYVDGSGLLELFASSPVSRSDPLGTSVKPDPGSCGAAFPSPSSSTTLMGMRMVVRLVCVSQVSGDCTCGHCMWRCLGEIAFQRYNPATHQWEDNKVCPKDQNGRYGEWDPAAADAYEYWHGTSWSQNFTNTGMPTWVGKGTCNKNGGSSIRLNEFNVGPIDCGSSQAKGWSATSPQGTKLNALVSFKCVCF